MIEAEQDLGRLGQRSLRWERRAYDVVVVGGGMAGIAAAILAAREGATVALVHDRPVLGGNASSEIRVNLEGANGGTHNRFFVESGLAEDLLLLNLWRNPTGSADHWSALLLDMVLAEERLDLHLDTAAHAVGVAPEGPIASVDALTLASERAWTFNARYVVDATGDGTIAYLAGASYMRGHESRTTFGEPSAPAEATDLTLGGTMQFMCVDAGRPVHFEPPAFARKVTGDELRIHRTPNIWGQAPVLGGFWWIEYGGALDTIADNAAIKRALLAEVYGLWDYVKNSSQWREKNRNLDLVWVAALPGKRGSRRIIGDHVLTEQDVVGGSRFDDAVAFGGWSIDDHPPRGFLDIDKPPSVHYHLPAVYQIPLRSLYARDIPNLYLAGRDISCSHLAHCSTRVMLTCLHAGAAVGIAAALSARTEKTPREIVAEPGLLAEVRRRLQRHGHYIPHVALVADRPPCSAVVTAASWGGLSHPVGEERVDLSPPRMLSLPVTSSRLDSVGLWLESPAPFGLEWRAYAHDPRGSWLPGDVLARGHLDCPAAAAGHWVDLPLSLENLTEGYVHVAVAADRPGVRAGATRERPLGPLSWKWLSRRRDQDLDAVPKDRRREEGWSLDCLFDDAEGDEERGVLLSSYWGRDGHGWGGPEGPALAFRVAPAQPLGRRDAILDPYERPTTGGVHAWVSDRCDGAYRDGKFYFADPQWLRLDLDEPTFVDSLEVYFNSDVERHVVNVWYSYPSGERAIATLVADFTVEVCDGDGQWVVLGEVRDHYQRRWDATVQRDITAARITCLATHGERYASIVDVRLRQAADDK